MSKRKCSKSLKPQKGKRIKDRTDTDHRIRLCNCEPIRFTLRTCDAPTPCSSSLSSCSDCHKGQCVGHTWPVDSMERKEAMMTAMCDGPGCYRSFCSDCLRNGKLLCCTKGLQYRDHKVNQVEQYKQQLKTKRQEQEKSETLLEAFHKLIHSDKKDDEKQKDGCGEESEKENERKFCEKHQPSICVPCANAVDRVFEVLEPLDMEPQNWERETEISNWEAQIPMFTC
jgi:hypothetical protein